MLKTYALNWRISLYYNDINMQTGEIFQLPFETFSTIDVNSSKFDYISISLIKGKVTIDDGIFLENLREIEFIKDKPVYVKYCNGFKYIKEKTPLANLHFKPGFIVLISKLPQKYIMIRRLRTH
jgi:hypothetical protein